MRQNPRFLTRWGVTFRTDAGERWHSYRDFGLLPAAPPDFGTPSAKTNFVDIPGMNGSLDLTEALGDVTYSDRPLSLAYYLTARREAEQSAVHAQLLQALHGRRLQVIPDEDPDWYYEGRLAVSPIVHGAGCSTITITGELDPYCYGVTPPPYEAIEISGYHNSVTIRSSPLGGTPRVRNNGEELMLLNIGNTEYQLPAGEWVTLTEVELPRSFETVTWDVSCPGSSGTITIDFKTGRL